MRALVVGTGYVGLVTAACMAEKGINIIALDKDQKKIDQLLQGKMPFYEPSLGEMVSRHTTQKKLQFISDWKSPIGKMDAYLIAVGTPPLPNGAADLSMVELAFQEIITHSNSEAVIILKSTVPPGTAQALREKLNEKQKNGISIVNAPEFLREGSAIRDTLEPDRIVIGVSNDAHRPILEKLLGNGKTPVLWTDNASAELVKYASNAFLATKISFANLLSHYCEAFGGNVFHVTKGMGMDSRIGSAFLNAGIGYGGSCFPKDVDSFIFHGKKNGLPIQMMEEVKRINSIQRAHFLKKIHSHFGNVQGKKFAVLGLAFKPNTDDIREAPALEIISTLLEAGAKINVFDPQAQENVRKKLGNIVHYSKNETEACAEVDAILITTEWPQFKTLDWEKIKNGMKKPIIFDGRNFLPELREKGFTYVGMGI